MRRLFAGVGLAALLAASPDALAQSYAAPKTSWGAPDLQGVWTNSSVTKLTRPAGIDKLVLTPTEAAALESKDFNNARTAIEKLPTDQSNGAPEKGKALPSVGNYNDAPAWNPSKLYTEIAYTSRLEGGVFQIAVGDDAGQILT